MKNLVKQHVLRLISVITILTLLAYILINFINENKTYATQYREEYSSKTANYPGYKELIDAMKAAHPNWNFKILYTGLDWNQVIKNETTAYHGRNLVPSSSPSSWICSTCGDKPYDTGWRCASEAAVSYFMDARNWINDAYIFQFENLSYNSNIQTLEGVNKITSKIGYMSGNTVTYTKTDGSTGTINKSYAQIIMEAAQEAGISPYHLASRIKQEQGSGTRPGSTATGTYGGYVGYYNFLNIGASGSGEAAVIANGLSTARSNGWTNPEISIKEGAKILASNYINIGQDTLYLQKFDVDDSHNSSLFYHQYMQNVSAAKTESVTMKTTYEELGFLGNSIEFIIPVYENMPTTPCPEPAQAGIVTQNVKVKGTNVNVRSGASTSTSIIATVNTGDTLLRIEMAVSANGGYYWDKVVLPNGRQGYVARNYLVETPDVTNCNETVITTGTDIRLRNGPGLTGTTVITTLTKGQVLTRIQKGAYNVDDYIWDRVKLSDGRQGYIAQNYIEIYSSSNGTTTAGELIRVICPSGLKVRKLPGISQDILKYTDKGDTLTRTQSNVSNENGYIWDKVVTSDGIEGYIARGDSTGLYIEVIGTVNGGNNTETTNNNFKIEESQLKCEPATTAENIKEKHSDAVIKNANGETITSGNIGTGYTITIGNNTYTVVKMGDVNGDGSVKATDYMKIKNYIMGISTLDQYQKIASDVNGDQSIKATDYMKIKNYIMGISNIEI